MTHEKWILVAAQQAAEIIATINMRSAGFAMKVREEGFLSGSSMARIIADAIAEAKKAIGTGEVANFQDCESPYAHKLEK